MKLNFAKRMSYIKASEIREILKVTEQEDVISFAGGLPAPELFPIDEINEINQIVLKEAGTKALQYTTTEGYVPLREWIANRMNERLGTTFDKDNILITHGSQQGLDLSGKVFLDEGDIVLCESPTYLAAISAFKAYGCSFIELPTDGDGMMMDVLVKTIWLPSVRIFVLIVCMITRILFIMLTEQLLIIIPRNAIRMKMLPEIYLLVVFMTDSRLTDVNFITN